MFQQQRSADEGRTTHAAAFFTSWKSTPATSGGRLVVVEDVVAVVMVVPSSPRLCGGRSRQPLPCECSRKLRHRGRHFVNARW
jgi:hypothetical protein